MFERWFVLAIDLFRIGIDVVSAIARFVGAG
jgi:hypothetical protein